MPDDAPDWSRKGGIYQGGWTSEQILAVFLSFTHMLRQSALVDSSTIRTAKSSLSGRRRKPGLVTYLSYRSRGGIPCNCGRGRVPPVAGVLAQVDCSRPLEAAVVSERAAASPDLDLDVHRGAGRCADQDVGQGDFALTGDRC